MNVKEFTAIRKFLISTMRSTCNDFIEENEKHECIGKLCDVYMKNGAVIKAYYKGMYYQDNNVYYRFNKVKKNNTESSVGFPALKYLEDITDFNPVLEVGGFRVGDPVYECEFGDKGVIADLSADDVYGCKVDFDFNGGESTYIPFDEISLLCE